MIATWRLIAAAVLSVLAYLLSRPVMEALLIAIRRRLGKGFQCVSSLLSIYTSRTNQPTSTCPCCASCVHIYRWIADMQRYMLLYLSWICFMLLLLLIAEYILQLGDNDALMNTLTYTLAVPVVLATLALRKVVANVRVYTLVYMVSIPWELVY